MEGEHVWQGGGKVVDGSRGGRKLASIRQQALQQLPRLLQAGAEAGEAGGHMAGQGSGSWGAALSPRRQHVAAKPAPHLLSPQPTQGQRRVEAHLTKGAHRHALKVALEGGGRLPERGRLLLHHNTSGRFDGP